MRAVLIASAIGLLVRFTPASAAEYACPRANLGFETLGPDNTDDTAEITLAGGAPMIFHFPTALDDIRAYRPSDLLGLWISMRDCSTSEFLCKRVEQSFWQKDHFSYSIVIPWKLVPGRTYDLDGIRVFTRRGPAAEDGRLVAQVVVVQRIAAAESRMIFTFEAGRGLVSWDGARFRSDDDAGELCVFVRGQPLFSSVRVQ